MRARPRARKLCTVIGLTTHHMTPKAAAAHALEPATAARLHGRAAMKAMRAGADHTGALKLSGVSPSSPRR